MALLDLKRLNNTLAIEEVMERNKTERIATDETERPMRMLGSFISQMNRKKAHADPKAQKRIAERIRRQYANK